MAVVTHVATVVIVTAVHPVDVGRFIESHSISFLKRFPEHDHAAR